MKISLSIFYILGILLCMLACQENRQSIHSNSRREMMLDSYLKMVDSMPYYDTSNLDHKILRAYKENDTLALHKLIDYIENTSITPWMYSYLRPCALNKEFDTLTADEAYQFSYESSFCDYYTVANIIQRGNNIKANVIVYRNPSIYDSIPCTIAEQHEAIIDSVTWAKFQEWIFKVDFWGLKEDNGYHGLDGNSLDVQGYKNTFYGPSGVQQKRSYVSRWSNSMNNLINPFLMLLDLCKISNGCITSG